MSDLAATNCGGCGCNEGGCNSILWIIILLSCCCGNNGGFCGNNGCKVPLTGKPPRLHGLGGFLSFTLVFPFSLCSLPLPAL